MYTYSTCSDLGKAEDDIFRSRHQKDLEFKERQRFKRQKTEDYSRPQFLPGGQFAPVVRKVYQ